MSPPGSEPDPARGRRLDRQEVLAFARERLAAYKLPKTIAVADGLPRTVSGTVDRTAVNDRFIEDSPATTDADDGEGDGSDGDKARDDDRDGDAGDEDGEGDDSNGDSDELDAAD